MKKNEHLIKEVYPGSIAEEMGIEPGDVLLRINKQEIGDVFDYRYYIKDDYIEVLIRKADGEEWLLEIDKDYDDDLGIEFDNGLMSDYRSCSNKCIFCFIDQMPPTVISARKLYHAYQYVGERCRAHYSYAACADQYIGAEYQSGTSL